MIMVNNIEYDETKVIELTWEFLFSLSHCDANVHGFVMAIGDYETLVQASISDAVHETDTVQSREELEGILTGSNLHSRCSGTYVTLYYYPFVSPNLR